MKPKSHRDAALSPGTEEADVPEGPGESHPPSSSFRPVCKNFHGRKFHDRKFHGRKRPVCIVLARMRPSAYLMQGKTLLTTNLGEHCIVATQPVSSRSVEMLNLDQTLPFKIQNGSITYQVNKQDEDGVLRFKENLLATARWDVS
ncbi:hypothetical protein PG991_003540 [Apiospora marii]|uniref:Uncharacterized protein n=1 Tax=Apiospora marii TaxID=335849 RepID=A0ABR1S3T2_9PEZI